MLDNKKNSCIFGVDKRNSSPRTMVIINPIFLFYIKKVKSSLSINNKTSTINITFKFHDL